MQFDQFRWYRIKVAGGLIAASRAPHASARLKTRHDIESVGKQRLQQGGKDRVNENSEREFDAVPFHARVEMRGKAKCRLLSETA
ncbi:hypothetical protein HNQ36_003752 [Afipia massiliensis]|uniref:Uncharacterized protein n=1 Tax=Afipia massiliensis TaxID=211460 RepID=A0A840N4B6_9BRAD|nr:hypothetical protein [Afipia massiliensis]MBB5053752.1 hypothetical protein [Afipia massiliensis]